MKMNVEGIVISFSISKVFLILSLMIKVFSVEWELKNLNHLKSEEAKSFLEH